MKPVVIDGQAYLCPTWEQMGQLVVSLAQQIAAQKLQFDRVVTLAQGGLSWCHQLQDLLRIKHASSIQVKFYQALNDTAKKPIVIQSLPISIEDESILIFDDIADTGESLKLALDYLDSHGAKQMTTSVIFKKPWSQVKPDYSAASTKAWVIFPHDAIEHLSTLFDKWSQLDPQALAARFRQLTLDPVIINYFLALKGLA